MSLMDALTIAEHSAAPGSSLSRIFGPSGPYLHHSSSGPKLPDGNGAMGNGGLLLFPGKRELVFSPPVPLDVELAGAQFTYP